MLVFRGIDLSTGAIAFHEPVNKYVFNVRTAYQLEATKLVPDMMQSKQKEVGIRVPQAPLMLAIAAKLGRPIVTTSATDMDGAVLTDAKAIKEALGQRLDLILDGGLQPEEPSTIVSLLNDEIEVLRQGKGILVMDT